MLLEPLRKLITNPIGCGLLLAVFWLLLFFGGRISALTVAESLIVGFALSMLVMFRGSRKRAYEIAGRNTVSTMREFAKLIKQGKAPKSKEQRDEYLEYINSLAAVYEKRNARTEIAATIFLLIMFLLYLEIFGFTFLAVLFAFGIAYGVYGSVHSRITLKRINAIKDKYYRAE